MEELTGEQLGGLEDKLEEVRVELEALLEQTRGQGKPVSLDQPIGRLSRMDAIQQQQMARAQLTRHRVRLQQVHAALARLADDDYGWCQRCEEPIGFKRLSAKPESPLCMVCLRAMGH